MIERLYRHKPVNATEEKHLKGIIALIEQHPGCYVRDYFDPGHVTGSALLLSADRGRVLMNHHKTLDRWLNFGGHADGDTDILAVARREVCEESGIMEITPLSDDIFDVDIHPIPANPRKGEPAHFHFDIRYIFTVTNSNYEDFRISDESKALRWCGYEEALALTGGDESMLRLFEKWKRHMAV